MDSSMAPYNAAERKDVRRAEKLARAEARTRLATLQSLMSSPGGRQWVLYLLERCHVFQSTFSHDALLMAYAEGERNVGLLIFLDVVSCCPDHYLTMMKERNNGSDDQPSSGLDPDDLDSSDDITSGYDTTAGDFLTTGARPVAVSVYDEYEVPERRPR